MKIVASIKSQYPLQCSFKQYRHWTKYLIIYVYNAVFMSEVIGYIFSVLVMI